MASPSTSPQLSASVTRILSLSNFPPELKTRDLIAAFAEWDASAPSATAGPGGSAGNANGGGFKVKWQDDTKAYIVFQDPGVAKRAYLQTLLHPHLSLSPQVVIRPYDGPDAQALIASVNQRSAGGPPGMNGAVNGHSSAPSLSMGGQRRGHTSGQGSFSGMGSFSLPPNPNNGLPANPTNISPPLAHARTNSASANNFGSNHTRMGSIGSGQASWINPAFTTGPSPPLTHALIHHAGGGGSKRESQAGGADAALGEIRRALASASLRSGQ